MTGRLQLIEQKLIAIDPAGFQNLCDAYLILRESEYSSLNRTGSQLGKQKTKFGTPDSFIRLEDNKLAYIEYTTQAESKVGKIKGDIDKCLDKSKTGVPPEKLFQIIVCFNSRLTIEEEISIQSYAESKNKRIELIGIDTLALEILSKYILLSRDFLGIPIDTGQILTFDKFIGEYNNKANQLSTPLDNEFLHRKDELKEILNYLDKGDLLLLSGAPGVGKTKIAIEAINNFIEKNTTYTTYAIAKKDVDIFEDLRIQLSVDKDYLLLIDDANRQLSNLSQILGVFKEDRRGNIKIIITVRNYALNDIHKLTNDLGKHIVNIKKFKDEEILQLVSSDSFKILNSKYQKKIVSISDGNARLAVMAAILANKKQTEFLWGDVSDLFDSYFDKFISDFDLFENRTVLKVLGIISFFYTVSRNNKSFIDSLVRLFDIDYYDFNEAIEELHKRELIEVQFSHARISEQVMAIYFFYKVFIKDNILSFSTLLNNFFPDWKVRFKDSIIPANISFGYENVITKIDHDLSKYLESISENEDEVLNFLDLFWLYKPADTISFFYSKILKLPEPESPKYITHYEMNDFVYEKEQTLDFISRFFNYLTEWFGPSIELGFEYVRKKPEHLPEFIRRIRENLIFDEPDESYSFARQVEFINILIDNFNLRKPHFISAFFAIAKTYLGHSFRNMHGGRENTITTYNYLLPFTEPIKEIRSKIWTQLFDNFNSYPDEIFNILKSYRPSYYDLVPEIMDYDLSLLVPFISENFSPKSFKHAHLVQNMIFWIDKEEKVKNRRYRELKGKFLTEDYLTFCKIDWDRIRDKHDFEFDNLKDYDNIKSQELKRNFVFKNEDDFVDLLTAITNLMSVKNDLYSASKSIDYIVEANFIKNNELGFKLLKAILYNFPKGLYYLHRTFVLITKQSEEWCLRLWKELGNWSSENSLFWKINFFDSIPDFFINKYYCNELVETINSIDRNAYLNIESFTKFNLIDKHVVINILKSVSNKIEDQNIVISYSYNIFENLVLFFESDYELIKRSYFQQYKINQSQIFDFKGKGFEEIYKIFPNFLIDFIKEFCTDRYISNSNYEQNLSFVWKYKEYFDTVRSASDLLVENNSYLGLGDHAYSILYRDIELEESNIAFHFLLDEIVKKKSEPRILNIYFHTIRKHFSSKLEQSVLFLLSINTDLEVFKEIDFVGNVGVVSGGTIFGELYAKKWENILEIVNKSKNTLKMIPFKEYLKKRILREYKRAEQEREMKFLNHFR